MSGCNHFSINCSDFLQKHIVTLSCVRPTARRINVGNITRISRATVLLYFQHSLYSATIF